MTDYFGRTEPSDKSALEWAYLLRDTPYPSDASLDDYYDLEQLVDNET